MGERKGAITGSRTWPLPVSKRWPSWAMLQDVAPEAPVAGKPE